jgi:hypothetical protein
VTVDLKAAIDSNPYFDDIGQNGAWISQKKVTAKSDAVEEAACQYIGATENGLLVILAAYSGGGLGNFIIDVAATRQQALRAHQPDEFTQHRPERPLEWRDQHREKHDQIVATRGGPADQSGAQKTIMIKARRPWAEPVPI